MFVPPTPVSELLRTVLGAAGPLPPPQGNVGAPVAGPAALPSGRSSPGGAAVELFWLRAPGISENGPASSRSWGCSGAAAARFAPPVRSRRR